MLPIYVFDYFEVPLEIMSGAVIDEAHVSCYFYPLGNSTKMLISLNLPQEVGRQWRNQTSRTCSSMGIYLDMIHGFLKGTKALPVPLNVHKLQRVDLYIQRGHPYFYVERREGFFKHVYWGPFSSQEDAIVYRDLHMEAYRTDGTLPPQPPLLEGVKYRLNWNQGYAAITPPPMDTQTNVPSDDSAHAESQPQTHIIANAIIGSDIDPNDWFLNYFCDEMNKHPDDWFLDYFFDEMNKHPDDWFNGDSSLAEKK